jgi:hypothetical protein
MENFIFKIAPPIINYLPSNYEKYSNNEIYIMKDENSLFENLINNMKNNSKLKFQQQQSNKLICSNPNCKNPFNLSCTKCKSCNNQFCEKCSVICENCNENICLFCESVKYEKYKDLILCPNCEINFFNKF